MLKKLFPLMIVAVGMLASCASDDSANGGGGSSAYNGVTAEVRPMEAVAENGTRSALDFSASEGMVFRWNDPDNNPDVLTVFPSSGAAAGLYTLKTLLDDAGTTARFEASGFSLSKDMRYFAFSKKEDKGAHPNWSFPSAGNITVDYSGQRQTESGDNQTAHLGEYDFMAATALCSAQDQAYFPFKHLGLTLRMILKGLPADVEYTALEIYDSENTFRQPIRIIDLTKGLDAQGNYTPSYKALDPTNQSYNDRFTLALGADAEHGITPSTDDGAGKKKIIAYIELPPHDFSGKDIVFSLKSKDGAHDYFGTYAGYKLNAGKAYQMTVNMQPSTTYTVNIKVDYDWLLGNDTRATGDPGVADGMEAPNYIYAFFCVGGKVKTYKHFKVGENGEQSNKSKDAWTDRDNNNIITYKTPLIFSASSLDDPTTARVYIAASRTALDITGITENVTPEVTTTIDEVTTPGIRDILYNMQGVVTTNVELDASQQFMRDLYSTPWSATNFVGKLSDPYQDVILYHVAAMVDLKWNSASILSGNVSVNNVARESLSLFQPTANIGANPTYTVTSAIDGDRMYNGRQVFFLPQFDTYNVTVGQSGSPAVPNTQDVDFNPATTGGFTSWLRWLKQY